MTDVGQASESSSAGLITRRPLPYATEVLADAPLVYYKLGDAGSTMVDSSGNGRNGSYGTTPQTTVSSLVVSVTDGAAVLNGSDAATPHASWMNSSNISVEFWVKLPPTLGGAWSIAQRWNNADTSNRNWLCSLNVQVSPLRFYPTFTIRVGSSNVTLNGPIDILPDETVHLVFTHDQTTMRIYKNGVEIASRAGASRSLITTTDLQFGITPAIDEFAYYDTVLSPSRVLAHYEAGISLHRELAVGRASEVASTSAVGATQPQNGLVGQASETDSAATVNTPVPTTETIGRATEADSARVMVIITPGFAQILGRASEADSASTLIGPQAYTIGRAIDVQTARTYGLAAPPAGSVITTRWTFYDPSVPELYTLPINPDKMDSPHYGRNLATASGVRTGTLERVRVIDTAPQMKEWSFTGVVRSQIQHDRLTYWAEKRTPIQITDHLDRTFEVIVKRFDPVARQPTADVPWRGRYTMTCLLIRRVS